MFLQVLSARRDYVFIFVLYLFYTNLQKAITLLIVLHMVCMSIVNIDEDKCISSLQCVVNKELITSRDVCKAYISGMTKLMKSISTIDMKSKYS